jgi:hypothetical protein
MSTSSQESWEKFLKPETLRSNLILASLFITSYETLKDSIIEQLKDFYTHGWDENGPVVSGSYETKVLSLDPKKNPFRASIAWLKDNQVIDEADERKLKELREHRNEVAHNLPKFIAEVGKEVKLSAITEIFELVTKIDRWWIVNVELETQEQIDPSKVNLNEIISGRMIFLQLTIGIATGAEFTNLHAEMEKRFQRKRQTASSSAGKNSQ